jgi:hypothetical protein
VPPPSLNSILNIGRARSNAVLCPAKVLVESPDSSFVATLYGFGKSVAICGAKVAAAYAFISVVRSTSYATRHPTT